VSTTPERILDAPDLENDFYLNTIDWSKKGVIAVALGRGCFMWHASSGVIQELSTKANRGAYISSVAWAPQHDLLAVGHSDSVMNIHDGCTGTLIRSLQGHDDRVSTIAWNPNGTITSAGRSSDILNHDLRQPERAAYSLTHHKAELCGLAYSESGQLASGGNDNIVCIWDACQPKAPRHVLKHDAAVKALAWSPHSPNVLATGAGLADGHIRLFNSSSGEVIQQRSTGSQVCSLIWSLRDHELLSGHGYSACGEDNKMVLWRSTDFARVATLTGHASRILNMAQSPEGDRVVSVGADETLRFWSIFREAEAIRDTDSMSNWMSTKLTIR